MQGVCKIVAMSDLVSSATALVRSWIRRLTPGGRRRIALERGALHSHNRKPGLTDVVRTGKVNSDGVDVHYYVTGCDTNPTATVVFIHGFTLAAEAYFLQADYLKEHQPTVRGLLVDLRGHGQTGKVSPDKCTVDGEADDVMEVIHAAAPSGPLILVGHSLGGLAAFNVIRRAPSDIRSRIAGLIVISTSIEELSAQGVPQILASPVAEKVYEAAEIAPEEADKFRDAVTSVIAPGLAVAVFRRPTNYKLIEFHAAMIHETPLETYVGFFDDLQKHNELEVGPYLADIPGYVIVGDKDDVTPMSQATRIHEVWPRAWQMTAHGAGHMVILESPGIVNKAIDGLLAAIA